MYPVSEANRTVHCLELKAYDYMLRFEKSFNWFESVGNAWAFLELCCKACGVEMENTQGRLRVWISEIAKPGTLDNIIIKVQHNCFSDNTTYSGRFIPILHEYVMIVRKDAALVVPILLTEKKECYIRDLPLATWRDVVAAIMESCKEAVPLSYLYEQIQSHKKAKENQWWREKIRQTLQCHPKLNMPDVGCGN